MNVVSFSLYGSDLKYYKGALENANLCPKIYPNWQCRFYIDNSVDPLFVSILKSFDHVYIVHIKENLGPIHGMYWRYMVNDEPGIDKYIIRDADSRLNVREQAAVNAWIESNKGFHIMRDCPGHTKNIQGGIWGGTANKFNMSDLVQKHASFAKWGDDETFLSNHIWPLIKDDCIIHDPYRDKILFPHHPQFVGFVGERYGLYNNRLP